MKHVEDILKRVGGLQPLPGTVVKLIDVINDPNSTVDEIVEVIKYDQAVTSQMLRIVNSAFFGLTREVNSLHDAMRCLGTVKIMQLVMAVHTNSLLAKGQKGYGMSPGKLWQHSVAVAIGSSALGEKMNFPNKGLLFTAGLLHDIGKVVLNEYVADEFAEIVRRVTQEKVSFLEAEQQVLGFAHDEIGGKVAEQWQLPDAIRDGIRYHHRPSDLAEPTPLVDALHLADCICLLLGIGLGSDGLYYRADEAVMARHGLYESDLEVVGAQVMVEMKRVEDLFTDKSARSQDEEMLAWQEN